MEKICDLHTHSVFSDGTFTPTEIISESERLGLSAVALCDHNTVDGVPEFLASASTSSVEAIAGAEFSVDYQGKELHLLGLFIPERFFSHISELMVKVNERKEESNIELVNSLRKSGFSVNYESIKRRTPRGKVNRAHIAEELTRKGYTNSVSHAFETLLSKSAGYYREPERFTAFEIIDFINSIGAIPVLAHPFLNLSEKELLEFLPKAKKQGLKGMECQYSLYDAYTTQKSIDLSNSLGLMLSGGSDFHGEIKPDIKLGIGKGNLKIPYEWALKLRT